MSRSDQRRVYGTGDRRAHLHTGNVARFGIQETNGWLLTSGFGYQPLFYGAAVAYLLALGWIHLLVPRIVAEDEA